MTHTQVRSYQVLTGGVFPTQRLIGTFIDVCQREETLSQSCVLLQLPLCVVVAVCATLPVCFTLKITS